MPPNTKQPQISRHPTEIRRSAEFKYFYSNAFSLGMSSNELILRFGLAENPATPTDMTDQVGVILSLVGAKSLAVALAETIKKFEADSHTTIPFPEDKLSEMRASLAAGMTTNPIPNK